MLVYASAYGRQVPYFPMYVLLLLFSPPGKPFLSSQKQLIGTEVDWHGCSGTGDASSQQFS